MVEKLFIDGIVALDPDYNIIRDDPDPTISARKDLIEELWMSYYPYADRDFRQKMQEDFHSRFWEMYLTCTLMQESFNVSQKQNP